MTDGLRDKEGGGKSVITLRRFMYLDAAAISMNHWNEYTSPETKTLASNTLFLRLARELNNTG
jgi:hypothetical protein